MRKRLRVVTRLVFMLLHIVSGFMQMAFYRLRLGPGWYRLPAGQLRIQWWMRRLNRILALQVEVVGYIPPAPVLLVANHISWLDIPALASVAPGAFVAKAEVRRWPLLGALAADAGTLFLARHSLSGMRELLTELQGRLHDGVRGVLFPEGTSTDGREVQPFFPGLFQAARDAGVPVQAVALTYHRDGERDRLAPFVGDDEFFAHLLRLLAEPQTCVRLSFAEPLHAAGLSRQVLAEVTRDWIASVVWEQPPERFCQGAA